MAPDQAKMDTYSKRRKEIIFPDIETLEDWKAKAKVSKMSLSKFIFEHVDNSLRTEFENGHPERAKIILENKALVNEVEKFREKYIDKKRQLVRAEKEIERLRADSFLNPPTEGVRTYHEKLVELFETRKYIRSKDLIGLLEIDLGESKVLESIKVQIKEFEISGLLETTSDGWRWKYA